ncbi:MAG TPA: prepilin peptidase [Candidatus Omnitrophica bacterium]|nr:prepilin peptidase [Candidatus Omnitrophota bacterium]
MSYIIAFIFGLAVGSFLNVCIYRLPRSLSIVNPPSHCPNCKKKIAWYDNIPLLSFCILKGRCRYCSAKISPRYLIVELLTGLLFILLLMKFGLSWSFLIGILFTCILIIATFIDFEHYLIPDVLTYPGIVLGLTLSVLYPLFIGFPSVKEAFFNSLLGIFSGFFSLLVIGAIGFLLFKKVAMGGGDLKLLAMIGAFLGWKSVLLTICVSSVVGSVVGLTLIGLKVKKRKDYIPYGPYLSLAGIVVIFYGDTIAQLLFSL